MTTKLIDLHCDTLTRLETEPNGLRENSLQLDLTRMADMNVALQHFAIYIDSKDTLSPYNTCHEYIDLFDEEMKKNNDMVLPVKTYSDYLLAQSQHKIGALLTMEDAAPIEGRLDYLNEFFQRGVRMITLTWNYTNQVGYPNALYFDETKQVINPIQKGLTSTGIDVVKEMDRLGIVIDVSHGSDQLVRDVLTHSSRPFVASHSNARNMCFHSRNLPDELLVAISDRGGLIGMNFARFFLTNRKNDSLIDALVKHIQYIHNVAGMDCLALGSDFDGIPVDSDIPDIYALSTLESALKQSGMSQLNIDKLFYKNAERFYQDFFSL